MSRASQAGPRRRRLLAPVAPRGRTLDGGTTKRSRIVVVALAAALAGAAPASASPFGTLQPATLASTDNPFPPGCGGPGEAVNGGYNYDGAEVEPYVAINPVNPANVVGAWQQDRWSDGGAHGLNHRYSTDGGRTFTTSNPPFSVCATAAA